MKRNWYRSLACCFLMLATAVPGAARQEEEEVDPEKLAEYLEKIDFEGFAEALREDYCGNERIREKNEIGCSFDEILANYYAHIDLGAFHVAYPGLYLSDRKAAELLIKTLGAMVDLQYHLAGWVVEDQGKLAEIQGDAVLLRDWIHEWKAADVGRVERAESREFLVAMEAPPEVVAAADRLRDTMRDGVTLGMSLQLGEACQVILCPSRLDFIQVVSICGEESREFQDQNWAQGLDQWTQCWREWTVLLSLEYAPWSGFDEEFDRGMDMKRFDKDGLRMMVVQQTAAALMHNMVARQKPWHEEDALSRLLVIAVCGRINTLDNERGITTSGGQSAPYEVFIPGGNPGGGALSSLGAPGAGVIQENQWREGHGDDFFVSNLSKGQRHGGKKAKKDRSIRLYDDPVAHFMLEGDKGSKHIVTAPFMGPHADESPYPPEDFLHDYRQFFQSYMTCFLHWLRENGASTPEESHKKFATFLQGMSSVRSSGADLDAVFQEIYGIPISAKDGKTDNLEWRFLHWLEAEG